jgi:hypothetical protein
LRPVQPALLPHRSLAEQNTILVGANPDAQEAVDLEGIAILRPADPPRVLTFVAEDADEAQSAIERFVSAMRPDFVRARKPAEVELNGIRVVWRIEGDGPSRMLRVVALPVDPYVFESRPARVAEALGKWAIVNGVYPRTMTSFEAQTAVVTCIHVPRAKAKMPAFEAAREEFRARGMTLGPEEVVQSKVVEVARDAKGQLVWSFFWEENQQHGTYGVRHHAEPLDTAGEQELLLAIFRRALGRDVRILLNSFD